MRAPTKADMAAMRDLLDGPVYTAGPMTGIPHFNFPAFDAAAKTLRERGFTVISPAELDDDADREAALQSPDGSALSYGSGVKKTWAEFLARDVKLLTDGGIVAVFVLPGWRNSRGARLETFVAAAMNGKPVYCLDCYLQSDSLTKARVSPYALETAWAGRPHDGPGGHE